MAKKNDTTSLTELLLQCMVESDPILSMLEWLRTHLIEAEVSEQLCSEAALIQVVQEAFVQGISTRKMDKLAKSLGIENLSRSQVSEMIKSSIAHSALFNLEKTK